MVDIDWTALSDFWDGINWSSVSALAGLLAALFAFLSVRILAETLKETRRSADAAAAAAKVAQTALAEDLKPYVIAYFDFSSHEKENVILILENIGKAPATNIKFVFNPDVNLPEALSRLSTRGLKVLAPGTKQTLAVGGLNSLAKAGLDYTYSPIITYDDNTTGVTIKREVVLDVTSLMPDSSLEGLQRIRDALSK